MLECDVVKAIVQRGYGPPGVLSLEDVDRPSVEDDEVLVRVAAASLNVLDWRKMRAKPFVVRSEGLRRPRQPVLGVDASGVVEAVGSEVTHLRPGDEVFGIGKGALAEYTVGKTFAPKPANLTFEQAAAVPVAGSTALQAVRDIAKVEAGRRVLVNGAGGGVGHLIVQVAKVFGAHVTATTRRASVEFVRSIGADEVIDYTADDFRSRGQRYDAIFEVGGGLTLRGCRSALAPSGRLVFVGAGAGVTGPIGRFAGATLRAKVMRQPVVAFVSWESTEDLLTLKDLIEARKVTPAVDRAYTLAESVDAVRFLEAGGVRGKVVIKILRDGPRGGLT
ncbi:MAG TPA: NAD(P)-dependent alcohol dehydrogenase [Actinomycetota bacterium]|nr:NAD(P)-dependent alcohol dehydrogenase [Actinomycetota bacterium]